MSEKRYPNGDSGALDPVSVSQDHRGSVLISGVASSDFLQHYVQPAHCRRGELSVQAIAVEPAPVRWGECLELEAAQRRDDVSADSVLISFIRALTYRAPYRV